MERELGWREKCKWVEQSVLLVGRGPKGLRCAVCLSLHSLMDVVYPAPALCSSSFPPKSFISGTLHCFAHWLTEWNWSSARQAEGRGWGWRLGVGVLRAVKASGTRGETQRVGSKECFQLPEFCTWHVSCSTLYPVCNNNSASLQFGSCVQAWLSIFLPFP